ncbi:hypothetical protein HK098_005441 [Nowakowskiella sp. JEL0407]|nr:hypothetical protein HK098_005441 [Nowakowskiella sp. JEL0407]
MSQDISILRGPFIQRRIARNPTYDPTYVARQLEVETSNGNASTPTIRQRERIVPSYLKQTMFDELGQKDLLSPSSSSLSPESDKQNVSLALLFPHPISAASQSAAKQAYNSSNYHQSANSFETKSTVNSNSIPPLPSELNPKDMCQFLSISKQNLRVKYEGDGKKDEAGTVRSNFPIPPQCGLYYFEVEIISKGRDGYIGIGFGDKHVTLSKLPGWESNSWGYHGDDGKAFASETKGKPYGPQFSTKDVIGCGINFHTMTAFFTKNGLNLGIAFRNIKGTLYPSIGLNTPDEEVEVNFGTREFVYDIDQHFREETYNFWKSINEIPIPLYTDPIKKSPQSENPLVSQNPSLFSAPRSFPSANPLDQLVLEYLIYHGYTESATEFYNFMKPNLGNSSDMLVGSENSWALDFTDYKVSIRQEIRNLIGQGSIDEAIKLCETSFPNLIKENENIHFALECRRFIELVARLRNIKSKKQDDMDIDRENDDDSDDSGSLSQAAQSDTIWEEVLTQGRHLHSKFSSKNCHHTKEILTEVFSLIAYEDPTESPAGYLFSKYSRETVADALNKAILGRIGKPEMSSLEAVYKQAEVTKKELLVRGVGAIGFGFVAYVENACNVTKGNYTVDPLWKNPAYSWIALTPNYASCSTDDKVDNINTFTKLGGRLRGFGFLRGDVEAAKNQIMSPVKAKLPAYMFSNTTSVWLINQISASATQNNTRFNVVITPAPVSDSQPGMQFILGGVIMILSVSFLASVVLHLRNYRYRQRRQREGEMDDIPSAGFPEFDHNHMNVMDRSLVEALPIKTWTAKRKRNRVGDSVSKKVKDVKDPNLYGSDSKILKAQEAKVDTTPQTENIALPEYAETAKVVVENMENTNSLSPNEPTEEDLSKQGSSSLSRPHHQHEPLPEPLNQDESEQMSHNTEENTKAKMSQLDRMSVRSSTMSSTRSAIGADTCAVCLEDYEDGDVLRELPCKHLFHSACIDRWLTSRSNECPLCKREAGPAIQAPQNIYINAFRYTYYDDSATINGDVDDNPGTSERTAPWHSHPNRNSHSITFPPPANPTERPSSRRTSRHFLRFALPSQPSRSSD